MAIAQPWSAPTDLDPECETLCRAINENTALRTIECCCGHGREPYRIWFVADSLDDLPPLLWCFDGCHCGHYGWQVIVTTDCGMSPATFRIEGPVGAGAYAQADDIARLISETDLQAYRAEAELEA